MYFSKIFGRMFFDEYGQTLWSDLRKSSVNFILFDKCRKVPVKIKMFEKKFFLAPNFVKIVSELRLVHIRVDFVNLPMNMNVLWISEPPTPQTRLFLIFVRDCRIDHIFKFCALKICVRKSIFVLFC